MGRTLPSFRIALEMEIQTWMGFRRGLRAEDRPFFDEVMKFGMQHGDAGSLAARCMLSENIFLSALIEQQKQIHTLQEELKILKKFKPPKINFFFGFIYRFCKR